MLTSTLPDLEEAGPVGTPMGRRPPGRPGGGQPQRLRRAGARGAAVPERSMRSSFIHRQMTENCLETSDCHRSRQPLSPAVAQGKTGWVRPYRDLRVGNLLVAGSSPRPPQVNTWSERSAFPVLGNAANKHRTVSLTAKQFHYAFGNTLTAEESDALHAAWTIPGAGIIFIGARFIVAPRVAAARLRCATRSRPAIRRRCPSATSTAYQSPLGDPDQEGTEALTNRLIRIGHRGFVEAHHAEPSRGPRSCRKPSMQCAYPGGRGGIRNH
jgi:hypothetical protein